MNGTRAMNKHKHTHKLQSLNTDFHLQHEIDGTMNENKKLK